MLVSGLSSAVPGRESFGRNMKQSSMVLRSAGANWRMR